MKYVVTYTGEKFGIAFVFYVNDCEVFYGKNGKMRCSACGYSSICPHTRAIKRYIKNNGEPK